MQVKMQMQTNWKRRKQSSSSNNNKDNKRSSWRQKWKAISIETLSQIENLDLAGNERICS